MLLPAAVLQKEHVAHMHAWQCRSARSARHLGLQPKRAVRRVDRHVRRASAVPHAQARSSSTATPKASRKCIMAVRTPDRDVRAHGGLTCATSTHATRRDTRPRRGRGRRRVGRAGAGRQSPPPRCRPPSHATTRARAKPCDVTSAHGSFSTPFSTHHAVPRLTAPAAARTGCTGMGRALALSSHHRALTRHATRHRRPRYWESLATNHAPTPLCQSRGLARSNPYQHQFSTNSTAPPTDPPHLTTCTCVWSSIQTAATSRKGGSEGARRRARLTRTYSKCGPVAVRLSTRRGPAQRWASRGSSCPATCSSAGHTARRRSATCHWQILRRHLYQVRGAGARPKVSMRM